LNRIMTLLRHALGEDAHAPRYLHTLHGVGYRFDLPGVAAPEPAAHERRTQAERRVEPTDTLATEAATSTSAPSTRRWRLPVMAALLLGAALLSGWFARRLAAPPAPAPATAVATMAKVPTLIVMPLKPIGDGENERAIAAGLSDELISALSRIEGLRVIARESTELAAARSPVAAALVPRLGISHALEGSVRQSDNLLRFHLRLTEAQSGRTLWARDYDRDAADLLALQREVAGAVAAALTLKLGLLPSPAAAGGDARFLARYFAAQELLRTPSSSAGDAIERAETEFRALTRQRPDDARAQAGLAVALEARAFNRPPLAEELRAEAALAAALAKQLDPNLAEPYRVQAAAACRSNRWDDCLQLLEHAQAASPSDSRAHFQYAMSLAALGYINRAEALLRDGTERDPINPVWRFGHGRVLDTLGRHDEAHFQLQRSAPYSPYARWFNAVWRGDTAIALRLARQMGDQADAPQYERLYKASYVAASRALQDPTLWPQAEVQMRASERRTGLMNFLRVLLPEPDPAELIAELDLVRERSYSSWDLLLWTRNLAYLRQHPAFQDYLRDNGILAYWQARGFPPQCRAHQGGAVCD